MTIHPDDDPAFNRQIGHWIAAQELAMQAFDAGRPATAVYLLYPHVHRVADMGRAVALFLGAPIEAATWYHHALVIHDIGKCDLPSDIWDTDEKPSEIVKSMRRRHAPIGAEKIERDLPQDHPFTSFAADIARHHHEQMDGKGFMSVTANELSPWVRLACIVDSFDGMSVVRPHFGDRDTSPKAVYERIAVEKGTAYFDHALTQKFGAFLGVTNPS